MFQFGGSATKAPPWRRDWIQVVSKVLILAKKEPRQCIWWSMRARTLKISMKKWCSLARCH